MPERFIVWRSVYFCFSFVCILSGRHVVTMVSRETKDAKQCCLKRPCHEWRALLGKHWTQKKSCTPMCHTFYTACDTKCDCWTWDVIRTIYKVVNTLRALFAWPLSFKSTKQRVSKHSGVLCPEVTCIFATLSTRAFFLVPYRCAAGVSARKQKKSRTAYLASNTIVCTISNGENNKVDESLSKRRFCLSKPVLWLYNGCPESNTFLVAKRYPCCKTR